MTPTGTGSSKRARPLTDAAVRGIKPGSKPFKVFDGRGLFLLVTPAGGKLWRMKYRFAHREKSLAFGAYPDVSLAHARDRRDEARKLLAAGTDPSEHQKRRVASAAATFEAIATEWFETFKSRWTEGHARTVLARMEQHLFPFIGKIAIRDLTAPDVLRALRRIEAAGTNETARRVRQICSQVARYAIATSRADRDPSADLRGALAPVLVRHRAAITEPKDAAVLLRVLDTYQGSVVVRSALKLAPLLFVRPGELRKAEWSEIDLERQIWLIPARRMKMREELFVPLSRQAVAIFRELYPVTGHGRFVFPSARGGDRPMSDNAILAALRRSGVSKDEMTGHGFRALARTVLDEVLRYRVDLIEHQLGHAVRDPNGRAYNRTSFLAERTEMMQRWADYLESLRKGDQG
jgi:integrase